MGVDTRQRMLREAMRWGHCVKLNLKENTTLDRIASTVPTFMLSEDNVKSKYIVTGRIMEMNEEYLGVALVWDKLKESTPVSGVNVYLNTIDSSYITQTSTYY